MAAKPQSPLPPAYFRRADETDDALFYTMPRLVTHIDEALEVDPSNNYVIHLEQEEERRVA